MFGTFLLIMFVMVIVLTVIVVAAYSMLSPAYTKIVTREIEISTQYNSNRITLSDYTSTIADLLGIKEEQSGALRDILHDTMQGRYGEDGFSANGGFFSAVNEAYPEMATTKLMEQWQTIQEFIISKREAYNNEQKKLNSMIQEYDDYRNSDLLRSFIFGFFCPTDNLVAQVGIDNIITGKEAYWKIRAMVTTQESQDAYNSGILVPIEFDPMFMKQ